MNPRLAFAALALALGMVGCAGKHPQLVIHWQVVGSSEIHHGEPIDATSATAWVEILNRRYPTIRHWTEEAR